MGTMGQILWDQDTNTVTITQHKIENRRAMESDTVTKIEYKHDATPLEAELKHWIDCVNTRKLPTTGLEAAKNVAVVIDQVKKLI